jgi:Rrf2 family protein
MSNILKISEACSLALHSLGLMAAFPDKLFTTHEIAETFQASEAHLSKVLQRLAKADLVNSTRGPHGGFSLSTNPENINLLQVYELIEGSLPDRYCLLNHQICNGSTCILGDLVENITKQARQYLSSTNLADLKPIYMNKGD